MGYHYCFLDENNIVCLIATFEKEQSREDIVSVPEHNPDYFGKQYDHETGAFFPPVIPVDQQEISGEEFKSMMEGVL